MKVLGYIAAMNDQDVIDACIDGLRSQTVAVDRILIVDNGSVDGTADRSFPDCVTVIHHPENQGTNGAAITGFRYALEHGFDWTWVFDADTVARPDALQRLLEVYGGFDDGIQQRVRLLGSLPVDAATGTPHHGITFTTRSVTRGFREVEPTPGASFYECDSTMWTGSLFRMAAVQEIGLPSDHYFLDWGDHEYGYIGARAGYRAFMVVGSVVDHNLHPMPSVNQRRLGPFVLETHRSPPIRRYYFFRNFLYFWFYEFDRGIRSRILAFVYLLKLSLRFVKIGLLNRKPGPELSACLRGMRDGLSGDISGRF